MRQPEEPQHLCGASFWDLEVEGECPPPWGVCGNLGFSNVGAANACDAPREQCPGLTRFHPDTANQPPVTGWQHQDLIGKRVRRISWAASVERREAVIGGADFGFSPIVGQNSPIERRRAL
jgi:hypothetical protein